MKYPIELLEERVASAVALIASLRTEIGKLRSSLADEERRTPVPEPAAAPSPESAVLAAENARLLRERSVVRERLRGLIREIDRVTG